MNNSIKTYDKIVINDAGEEIDDEIAIWWLHKNYPKDRIAFVCVGGNMKSINRLTRLKYCIPTIKDIYTLEEFHFVRSFDKHVTILQIGPISKLYEGKVKQIINTAIPYTYILQGKYNASFNSRGESAYCANLFIENSCEHIEVSTPYPKFTYNNASLLPYRLRNEVIKLGFRNTLGRAEPSPYTVHLIGPGGANFETVRQFNSLVNGIDLMDIVPSKTAIENATLYVREIDYSNEFVFLKMSELKQTQKSQLFGLAKILTVFEDVFHIYKVIYSKDAFFRFPENSNAYDVFTHLINENPDTELTPAYDLKAAFVLMNEDDTYLPVDEILNVGHEIDICLYVFYIFFLQFAFIIFVTFF